MPRRYQHAFNGTSPVFSRLGLALRVCLKVGYKLQDLRADALAGLVVGIVALPLGMALAIASGVEPQRGLYTVIVAGALIALLGGSRFNVSGPTAAFVVILAPIAAKYGVGGLLLATLIAGVVLVGMGLLRMGRLIQFIPHPVTTGFTAGIAVVIATLQIKDFFALKVTYPSEHYLERLGAIVMALPTLHWSDTAIGVLTLAILVLWPRLTRRVPAPLVAIVVGSLAGQLLIHLFPEATIATIGSRFTFELGGQVWHGIPQLPPLPVWPWSLPAADGGALQFSWPLAKALLGAGATIAMLGAIESLLCAVVADGMGGARHDPNVELLAQGAGNIVTPFFGGIPATAAIARTATAIRSGARTPVAAVVHALFVLLVMVTLAPLLSYIPMASLAALLLIVAWHMSEARHFLHTLKVAPMSDALVLIVCFTFTVVFDMVLAVGVGIVLAALLFMRRMADISGARLYSKGESHPHLVLPKGVLLYEINGPLFFGAAEKAISALETVSGDVKRVLLDVSRVPAMDVTGLVALESAINKLKRHAEVVIVGVQPQPHLVLTKAGWVESGKIRICQTMAEALAA